MNLEQFFHEALAVLWSIPLALGLMMLIRMVTGRPAPSENESMLFFGVSKQQAMTVRFTVRMWATFIAFCVAGYLEQAYLMRFGFGWFVLAYIATLGGMLAWLRQSWHWPSLRMIVCDRCRRSGLVDSSRRHYSLGVGGFLVGIIFYADAK